MTKRTTYLASLAVLALGAVSAPTAQAKFEVVFAQVGSNVEEIGAGTLDLTDLGPPAFISVLNDSLVVPNMGGFAAGTLGSEGHAFFPITGPSFGSGPETDASRSAGDFVSVSGGDSGGIVVPLNYTSGTSLFNWSIYFNASFASLGMTPGSYVWTWGSGADSFTMDIAVPTAGEDINSLLIAALPLPPQELFPLAVPEPSTWAMMLLGLAGLGYAAVRRKGARPPVSA